MLKLQARVDMWVMVMKEYSAFIKASISTWVSSSDFLESYQDTCCGVGSYPLADMHSVYPAAPVDWASIGSY